MLSSAVFQRTSPRSLGWNTGRAGFSEPGCLWYRRSYSGRVDDGVGEAAPVGLRKVSVKRIGGCRGGVGGATPGGVDEASPVGSTSELL